MTRRYTLDNCLGTYYCLRLDPPDRSVCCLGRAGFMELNYVRSNGEIYSRSYNSAHAWDVATVGGKLPKYLLSNDSVDERSGVIVLPRKEDLSASYRRVS